MDWLCLPRFDSPALFARLLDHEAGHFVIAPTEPGSSSTWRYLESSLVLETTWTTPKGKVVTTDALALGNRERGHDLGQTSPGVLLRQVECVEGTVPLEIAFVPRPEYGLVHPRLRTAPGGVVAHGGATVIVLSTDLDLQLKNGQARAKVDLHAGESACFAVEQHSVWSGEVKTWGQRKIRNRLGRTSASWRSWSQLHQRYDGPLRELVHHSGVVLQGLTFAPSGAVVAAPTTSLPEGVGSGRTWDYRYAWVRDASMTLQALFISACPEEAGRFFSYLATASATQLDRGLDLQIMFGIGGERDLSERELTHLSGWRNSSPVRVGNGAWSQRQLDVYGALMDSAFTLRDQLHNLAPETRMFLGSVVDVAASRWKEKDQGIWEMRGEARSYLHSKLMCWVALERGVALAELLDATADRVLGWERARDAVREAILTQGWNEEVGSFTQSFGSEDLDASVLLMVIVGFLPPTDPRALSTIDTIERGLSDQRGLLFRYLGDDGIDSSEGTFLLCTFWLAHALAVTGQLDRAEASLHRAAGYATDLGLFSEQIDPDTGDLLGNFPQAFSHIGLVNAAQALAEARAR